MDAVSSSSFSEQWLDFSIKPRSESLWLISTRGAGCCELEHLGASIANFRLLETIKEREIPRVIKQLSMIETRCYFSMWRDLSVE